MELVEERVVRRQMLVQELLRRGIAGVGRKQFVTRQDTASIGVGHKKRLASRV
jgi:hypothetical protein